MANDNNRVIIDRSYIDNFSVKKFTEENLIDKYFPDIDVSLRTVGMVGFTTEQVSKIYLIQQLSFLERLSLIEHRFLRVFILMQLYFNYQMHSHPQHHVISY